MPEFFYRRLFFIVCFFSPIWVWSQPDYVGSGLDSSVIKNLNNSIALIKQGKHRKGARKLIKISNNNPDFYQAHMTLGYFFQESNNMEKAYLFFSRALKAKPNSAIAYFNRGNCCLKQQKYSLAVADFSMAIRYDSLLFAAYNNLAVTRILNQGGGKVRDSELVLAKQNLKRIEQIQPVSEPAMMLNLGLIYLHLFAFDEALICFNKLRKLEPDNPKAAYYLAMCHYYLRNFPEARSLFLFSSENGFNKNQCAEFIRFIDYIFEQLIK